MEGVVVLSYLHLPSFQETNTNIIQILNLQSIFDKTKHDFGSNLLILLFWKDFIFMLYTSKV